MTVDPRSPCVIGVAQHTWREGTPEPLLQWAQVARAAAADARPAGGGAVLDALDRLDVVYCQSWQYDDPPARLAAELGIDAAHRFYSGIGGTTPQQLLAAAAESILTGAGDVGLVVGGEALDTRRRLKKQEERPAWSHPDQTRRPFPFEAPFIDTEIAHEVFQAWLTFALFDIGRRAHLDIAPDHYRARLGALMAPMTTVAAQNSQAWFPVERTADELITPTTDNRMVAYPYTKYQVAVMDVDMAAAVIIASHEKADALGVPLDRRVYLRGWCYATDPVYVAEHHDFHHSPAMRASSGEALTRAGIGIDDIAHLDLYSCFGSSLHYALDALGLDHDDARGVTVTGGLPYFGGPGSNYLTHSVATMVERLRDDAGAAGLVSGVGMHMTKHNFAVYSTDPGATAPTPPDSAALQAELDQQRVKPITDVGRGPATIATYSVVHGRDGHPAWGLVLCDLPDGSRCYARCTDLDLLVDLEVGEWVGRSVRLTPDEGKVNHVTL